MTDARDHRRQGMTTIGFPAVTPGAQLPHDTFSDLTAVGVLCVTQISFWVRLRCIPIPFRYPKLILHHALLFLGRLGLIFGSALFPVVVFRHPAELDRDIDYLEFPKSGSTSVQDARSHPNLRRAETQQACRYA